MTSVNEGTKMNFGEEESETVKEGIIFPDTFFRIFRKTINNMTWPVNLEMLIENKILKIIDGVIKESYFEGQETHLSIINLHSSNTTCLQMEDVLKKLFKIFQHSHCKYSITLENSNHSCQRMGRDVNLSELVLQVRSQPWWKLIFTNNGFKKKFLRSLQRPSFQNGQRKYRKTIKNRKPLLKDLSSEKRVKKVSPKNHNDASTSSKAKENKNVYEDPKQDSLKDSRRWEDALWESGKYFLGYSCNAYSQTSKRIVAYTSQPSSQVHVIWL
ncbi:hypothetical protein Avbf_03508 [Armadillidium vulgare]|nr:hypothetical protein Avbf_03508 [Armadillidium vulgare]